MKPKKASDLVLFAALFMAATGIFGGQKAPLLGPSIKDGIYPASAKAHGWKYPAMSAEVKNGMVIRLIRERGDIHLFGAYVENSKAAGHTVEGDLYEIVIADP